RHAHRLCAYRDSSADGEPRCGNPGWRTVPGSRPAGRSLDPGSTQEGARCTPDPGVVHLGDVRALRASSREGRVTWLPCTWCRTRIRTPVAYCTMPSTWNSPSADITTG